MHSDALPRPRSISNAAVCMTRAPVAQAWETWVPGTLSLPIIFNSQGRPKKPVCCGVVMPMTAWSKPWGSISRSASASLATWAANFTECRSAKLFCHLEKGVLQ